MSDRKRFIFKDMGIALAALSIYFLTLLAPLHHVSALQGDLAELGFETAGNWSICSAGDAQGTEKSAALQCPICSLVKLQVLAAPSTDYVAANAPIRCEAPIISQGLAFHPFDINFRAAPRAPPVLA